MFYITLTICYPGRLTHMLGWLMSNLFGNYGWAPPDCQTAGYQIAVGSGPALQVLPTLMRSLRACGPRNDNRRALTAGAGFLDTLANP